MYTSLIECGRHRWTRARGSLPAGLPAKLSGVFPFRSIPGIDSHLFCMRNAAAAFIVRETSAFPRITLSPRTAAKSPRENASTYEPDYTQIT